ncbi:MAG: AraC family transcriptional regulator [Thermoanaerobaculia bacterium]
MDPLVGLLDGPRARGAFALRCVMSPPWSLRVLAESPLTLIAVVTGEVWIVHDSGETVRLGVGDVAVTSGSDHYTVAGEPETEPDVVIHAGQRCCSLDGESLEEELMHGVRTWGNDPEGSTVMMVGAYESLGDLSDRLLRALPPLLWLPKEEWESPLFSVLCDEVVKDRPGQAAVLDRLIDLLLMRVLRAWFTRPEAKEPAWYRSQADPVVGRALAIMHDDPARRWTLSALARETGVSRAALARRFREVVGEPPMAFLTEWRLALAADLLCEPDATVGTIAPKVGYSSPFALSTAFKRVRGVSPQEHRARAMSPG